MNLFSNRGKRKVMVPVELMENHYSGKIYGVYFSESKVVNIFSDEIKKTQSVADSIGEIYAEKPSEDIEGVVGYWKDDELLFFVNGEPYSVEGYSLTQNLFSRNTGILESDVMRNKCVFILGCGSVGSLVALEMARAGVGKFVLIDSDIVEYHNLCRHQCSIRDVGQYKVYSVKERILEINPAAEVYCFPKIVEEVSRSIFDELCNPDSAILIGCADNRTADVYANQIAASYGVPFLSIGFWERAFAGEVFYWLPKSNMPCYKCALGDSGELSNRTNTNHRLYTTQEDLQKVNFEPGISVDINFVTTIGNKLIIDILNRTNDDYIPRVLNHLQQFTLVCNTNEPKIGGDMAEIFSYPLQVTTSLKVGFKGSCPPCKFE